MNWSFFEIDMLIVTIAFMTPVLLILWHSLWIERDDPSADQQDQVTIRIGSGEPLTSSEPVSSDSRFASRLLMDASGIRSIAFDSLSHDGYRVFDLPLASPGGAVLGVSTHVRTITLEPAKFQRYIVEEGLAQPDAPPPSDPVTEAYSKYAKALIQNGAGSCVPWMKPLGLELEIVPLVDELRLQTSSEFMVTFQGQPVESFGLWYVRETGEKTLHQTNREGRVQLKLDVPGSAVLKGIQMQTLDKPDLQRRSWWCSLCFRVSEH